MLTKEVYSLHSYNSLLMQMYVVDSSCSEQELVQSMEVFEHCLSSPTLSQLPLLVICSKQDLPSARSVSQVYTQYINCNVHVYTLSFHVMFSYSYSKFCLADKRTIRDRRNDGKTKYFDHYQLHPTARIHKRQHHTGCIATSSTTPHAPKTLARFFLSTS